MDLDRYRGCLLGLAVGDALGTTLEFKIPGSFAPLQDMVGGGPFRLQAGQWTDDTAMACCLAESLIACNGFDARDQMDRYLRWYRQGHWSSTGACFDIGNTIRSALERYEITGDPFAGSDDPQTAGNGSLMRLAPVVLFYAHHPAQAIEFSAESSRTTHAARTAVDACRYFAGLLIGALQGHSRQDLLAQLYSPLGGSWPGGALAGEVEVVGAGSFRRQPPEICGTGYVVQSLEAALWAFAHATNFEQGCLAAANLGEDADTTAAIYGQIAGAYFGLSGIPERWIEKIARGPQILALADQLHGLSATWVPQDGGSQR
jgi:ADP-ribosyl-[dinitrogen reductase] hydrolase